MTVIGTNVASLRAANASTTANSALSTAGAATSVAPEVTAARITCRPPNAVGS